MLERQLLEEFEEQLRQEADEKYNETQRQNPLDRDAAFAEVVAGYLAEAGVISDCELCPHEDEVGHSRCRIPPYDVAKFPNRWWKLHGDKPVRTLTAHIGKDTYSHIHYDSDQARVISVREAARLQSFPDGFVFSGTMNPAFRQIGNAVPPVLAEQLAGCILSSLLAATRPALAAE